MSKKDYNLDIETYRITQQKGTEPAFSHPYYTLKESGIYYCVCCDAPLFTSTAKYESGSGWPSFWQPYTENSVKEVIDNSHGMVRTEIICTNCNAHLGHVFPDGPEPTGLRYCVNGTSLDFKKK